mgnify:CR=1 FL=1
MKTSYAKAEVNVDKIVRVLENHQVVLMKTSPCWTRCMTSTPNTTKS